VRADAHDREVRTVNALHEHALRAIEVHEALLAAAQLRTAGMAWPEIAGSADVAAFLRGLDDSTPSAVAIEMFDPSGRLVQFSAAPFPPPVVQSSDRDFVQAQQGPHPGPFFSTAYLGRVSGQPLFTYSRPHLDAEGRPDGGTLTASFQPNDFSGFYASISEATGDSTLLLRSDGAVLARNPLPASPMGNRLAAESAEMKAVAAAPSGGVGFHAGTSSFDAEPRLYAARRLAQHSLAIVYGLHPDGPRRAWTRQVSSMAASAAGAMLLLLAFTALAQSRTRRAASALARERDALALARHDAEGRAEAEAALRRGQRLAVLGQIVAGVAHDFRNVTHAVQGGARLIGKSLDRGDTERARSLATMIAEAAGRGIDLTKRMLRSIGAGHPGDVAAANDAMLEPATVLASTIGLLRRTIGTRHRVRFDVDGPTALPGTVRGDPAELEAALLNLALNARDAMAAGGEIAVTATAEVVAHLVPGGPAPGRYVRISVADAGMGMDAETLRRVAQPFFTTKPAGQGTGLGLATARAFARNAGGSFRVESAGIGLGTTVTLWLPEPAEFPGRADSDPSATPRRRRDFRNGAGALSFGIVGSPTRR